uniref:Migration and invasion enhancer 1 n=1 Tax=Tabanus bromius TaxID=304241 RepID=A0A0K8TNU5_TABBR
MTKVDVEYCGVCNYKRKCQELAQTVKSLCPDIDVHCHQGRRGSFEVTINDTLVHSKLQSMAFPDFQDVAQTVKDVDDGKKSPTSVSQQPITDCNLM